MNRAEAEAYVDILCSVFIKNLPDIG